MNKEVKNTSTGEKHVIRNFTDLYAWKEGHILVISVYEITKSFPKTEIFGLMSQMRRCAVSITSNIAEGFSRQSYKEKVQFYSMALGSLTELENQIIISADLKYILTEQSHKLLEQALKTNKIINGLIKKSKSFVS